MEAQPATTESVPARSTAARLGQAEVARRDDHARIRSELDRARRRTEEILSVCAESDLERQPSELLSPIAWDIAHIANYEELWILREVDGQPPEIGGIDAIYDASEHARAERVELPLLSAREAREYAARVRERTLELLERVEFDPGHPLTAGAFAFGLVIQHEFQHQETMMQALQAMGIAAPASATTGAVQVPRPGVLEIEAGEAVIGCSSDPWAYDNERPEHRVSHGAFAIDRAPVTNARWLEFIEDGGYREPRHWSERGWSRRRDEGVESPLHWERADGTWLRRSGASRQPVPEQEPVRNISFFEAEAFANWAGARLPTEVEWEVAARAGLPGTGEAWEWTSSGFGPYPGFVAFPYREYSEVFFGGDFRMLRGGSWATDDSLKRPSFRNWDHPQRRQIFTGMRLARDA